MDTFQEIGRAYNLLFKKLPEIPSDQFLLTGGAAAFFYGSKRPFSHDIDIMLDRKWIDIVSKNLETTVKYNTNKPIFHSLAAQIKVGSFSYDLIFESIIDLKQSKLRFCLNLNTEIMARRKIFLVNDYKVFCIPVELLILLKLLAARGQTLGKYDLFDVHEIFSLQTTIDLNFFKKLVFDYTNLPALVWRRLLASAEEIKKTHGDKNIDSFRTFLKQF